MDKNFDLIDNAEYREFIERLKIAENNPFY